MVGLHDLLLKVIDFGTSEGGAAETVESADRVDGEDAALTGQRASSDPTV